MYHPLGKMNNKTQVACLCVISLCVEITKDCTALNVLNLSSTL